MATVAGRFMVPWNASSESKLTLSHRARLAELFHHIWLYRIVVIERQIAFLDNLGADAA